MLRIYDILRHCRFCLPLHILRDLNAMQILLYYTLFKISWWRAIEICICYVELWFLPVHFIASEILNPIHSRQWASLIGQSPSVNVPFGSGKRMCRWGCLARMWNLPGWNLLDVTNMSFYRYDFLSIQFHEIGKIIANLTDVELKQWISRG